MASCPKCGSVVSDGAVFCSVCGSPVSPVARPAAPVPPPPPAAPISPAASSPAGLSSNVAGALCYLVGLVTGIIFLVLEPYKRDQFVRFHAFQSIFFNIVWIIFWILWSNIVLAGLFSLGFLWSIFSLIGTLISLAFFLFWLFLMYKAYNKEKFMIPFIGEMASKQAAKQV
jgi:uncharacterized membrane protein